METHALPGGGHDLIHWVAAAALVVGGAIAVSLSAVAARRGTTASVATAPAPARTGGGTGVLILAGLSACAAFIHLAAAPGHFAEIGDLAAGFLVAGAFQAAWARSAFLARGRPLSRRLVALGLAGNGAIVGLWIVSRVVGVPFGHVDPVALPDGAATVFEVLIIAGLIWLRGPGRMAWPYGRGSVPGLAQLVVVPVLGIAVLVTSLATLAIAAGADHGSLPGGAHGEATGEHSNGH